jgi:hypothetical protein
MLQIVEIRSRIEALKEKVEEVTGMSKAKLISEAMKVLKLASKPKKKYKWDPEIRAMIPEEDDNGNYVMEFDSAGANGAITQLAKMLGYYEPTKSKTDITTLGEKLETPSPTTLMILASHSDIEKLKVEDDDNS